MNKSTDPMTKLRWIFAGLIGLFIVGMAVMVSRESICASQETEREFRQCVDGGPFDGDQH